MPQGKLYRGCAVILTAIQVEYLAVRSYLKGPREESYHGTIYERGTFTGGNWLWDVGIGLVGAGNSASAAAVERAITHFAPDIILFVGVAGGVKDVNIGDVVAVTKAYGYESGKVHNTGFLARPEVGMSSFRLVERAKAEARKKTWLRRIPGHCQVLASEPRVFVGPIAAGEKVMASTSSELFAFLHTHYNDILAIEMEGRGFLEAARANDHVLALIIRGISDLLDNKSAYDAQGSQEIAAYHASAFAFEILARLDVETVPQDRYISKQQPIPPNQLTSTSQIGGGTSSLSSPLLQAGGKSAASTPVEIYCSYTKEDENLVKQFQNQLASLQKQGLIANWSRNQVLPGEAVDAEVTRHLSAASIILLFISPEYMASDDCHQEMNRALERTGAVIIPILLHPVARLQDAPFSHLQCFPRDSRSISEWGSRKRSAFAQMANEISVVARDLQAGTLR